jgi:uncharacterized membrane protein
MKKLLACAMLAALAGMIGCYNTSPPGGPGATSNTGSGTSHTGSATTEHTGIHLPSLGLGPNEFKLKVPDKVEVKQGETKNIEVGIERGKDFDQDVKLSLSNPPKGVNVTLETNELKASAKEVPIKIEATKDAALGEHEVKVTGTPAKSGAPTSVDFKINVKQP